MKVRKAKTSRYTEEQRLAFKRFHAWRGIIAKADSLKFLKWCYYTAMNDNLNCYVESSVLMWLNIRKREILGQPLFYFEVQYLHGPEERNYE